MVFTGSYKWFPLTRGEQKNRLNRENQKKNNQKNWTVKKNRLKFWQNQPVQFGFGFISLKPKKPNRNESKLRSEKNRAKTESNWKTEPNQFEPVFGLKNRTETSRFEPVSVFFFYKYFGLVTFFIKTKSNWKWSPLPSPSLLGQSIFPDPHLLPFCHCETPQRLV